MGSVRPFTLPWLTLALVALLGWAGSARAQQQNHEGLAMDWVYPTVGPCRLVASGDFDGDGDRDLAIAEGDSTAISLWWNNGRARFEGGGALPIGHPFATFVVFDADLDGHPDLAVADSTPGGGIEVFRGLGGGRFGSPVVVADRLGFGLLVPTDLNGDGRGDLVAATSSAPYRVVAFLQTAQGAFISTGSFETGEPVAGMAAADFDGDGVTDVAFSKYVTLDPQGNVQILVQIQRGNGAGPFTELSTFPSTGAFSGPPLDRRRETLISIDLDRDGRTDLLAGARVHLNRGAGQFATHGLPLFGTTLGVAVGDLDRDGAAEVFVTDGSREAHGVRVVRNAWDPARATSQGYSLEYLQSTFGSGFMVSDDLDGDGVSDLAVIETSQSGGHEVGWISVLRSRAQGTPAAPVLDSPSPLRWTGIPDRHVSVARFHRSGPSELVAPTSIGTVRMSVDSKGVPSNPRIISRATRVHVLDANGDGRDDLALGFGGDSIGIALTGDDGESLPISSWLQGYWLTAGDLDGDKRPEIALRRTVTGFGEVVIAWNEQRGLFPRTTPTGRFLSSRSGAAIGDVTGGSTGELVLMHRAFVGQTSDTVQVVKVLKSGEARLESQSLIAGISGVTGPAFIEDLSVADVDEDRDNELVVNRTCLACEGRLQILEATQTGFVGGDLYRWSAGWTAGSFRLADVDGDGDLDVICASNWDDVVPTLQIRWNDGSGRFDELWARHLAQRSMVSAEVADVDGDAIPDIITASATNGSVQLGFLFGERGKKISRARPIVRVPARTPGSLIFARVSASAGALSLDGAVDLPAAGEAQLELFDLAGRRVAGQILRSQAPGERGIRMALPSALPKGVYWLALRQGTLRATTRVAIVR